MANLTGVQPRIRIYPAPESREAAQRMFALRRRLHAIVAVALLLLLLLAVQLGMGAA